MSGSQVQATEADDVKRKWVRRVLKVGQGASAPSGPVIGANRGGSAPVVPVPGVPPIGPRQAGGPTIGTQRDPAEQESAYHRKLREAIDAVEIARSLAPVDDAARAAQATMEDSMDDAIDLAGQGKFLDAIPLLDKAIAAATTLSGQRAAMRDDFYKRQGAAESRFKPLEQTAA